MTVLQFPQTSELQRLVTVLEQCGFTDPDELVGFTNWMWELAGSAAGLVAVPNTGLRCAVVAYFSSRVAVPVEGPVGRGSSVRPARRGSQGADSQPVPEPVAASPSGDASTTAPVPQSKGGRA